eukprot:364762-Chlamydomonas_euryale.AAC.4
MGEVPCRPWPRPFAVGMCDGWRERGNGLARCLVRGAACDWVRRVPRLRGLRLGTGRVPHLCGLIKTGMRNTWMAWAMGRKRNVHQLCGLGRKWDVRQLCGLGWGSETATVWPGLGIRNGMYGNCVDGVGDQKQQLCGLGWGSAMGCTATVWTGLGIRNGSCVAWVGDQKWNNTATVWTGLGTNEGLVPNLIED